MLAGDSLPPSPPVRRPEQRGRHVDARTKASLPPPVTMHLDHQGPPVTYFKAASRSPRRVVASSPELPMCMMCDLRWQPVRKKRRLLKPPLDQIQKQERDEQAALKKWKERELQRIRQPDARRKLVKKGARQQEEYNCIQRASGACP